MSVRNPEQLQAVHRFLNFNVDKEQKFKEIAQLAAELCEAPLALITIEDEIKYYYSDTGLTLSEDIIKEKLWHKLALQTELTIISDTTNEALFANIPPFVNSQSIKFYAGAPLTTHDGYGLGCICILDTSAKILTATHQKLLTTLAKRIIEIMEFEFSIEALKNQFVEAKDTEIKLRTLFNSTGSCHLLIGRKMEIMAFNKNMYEFIEEMHDVKLYPGIKVFEILKTQYLEDFINDYQKTLKGAIIKYEREVKYRSNKVIWWHVSFEPAYNLEGEIIGTSYNATDITEFKLYEQRIIEQNDSLKKIAYIQSHELRKPVASILGLIEVFKSNDYHTGKEDMMMLEKAAQELDAKIRTIVNFTE